MNDIECPYCGHEYEINHDDGAFYQEGDGDGEEDQCPECDKFFLVYTSITYTHEGQIADCLNGSPHKWTEWSTYLIGEKDENIGKFYERRYCEDCGKEEFEWHEKRLDLMASERFDK